MVFFAPEKGFTAYFRLILPSHKEDLCYNREHTWNRNRHPIGIHYGPRCKFLPRCVRRSTIFSFVHLSRQQQDNTNSCKLRAKAFALSRQPRIMLSSTEERIARRRAQDRIPTTLQAVFLASNRGHEVKLAPPDKVASKEYFQNNVFLSSAAKKLNTTRNVFGVVDRKAMISSRQNNGRTFQRSNGKIQRSLPVSLFSPNPHKASTAKCQIEPNIPAQITIKEKVSPRRTKPSSPKRIAKTSISLQPLPAEDCVRVSLGVELR